MVAIGRNVKVSYIGYLEDGTVFDSTEMHEGQLLEFKVGAGQMIPGFDQAVSDMELGETRTVNIPCNMGYGEYNEEYIEAIPCEVFPHWQDLPVGEFVVLNYSGGVIRVRILKIEDGKVFIDKNHELAGRDLIFDITVEEVEGEGLSAIEQEKLGGGCACGCDVLREQIDGDRDLPAGHHHHHGDECCC